jgi:hypothetical protein
MIGSATLIGMLVFCQSSGGSQEPFPLPAGVKAIGFRVNPDGPEVARYIAGGPQVAKPYVWPVLTPSGVEVTRPWPMIPGAPGTKDHKHQKSAWFCHGDVVVEGIRVPARKGVVGTDFWSEETGHGKIVLDDSENIAIGKETAGPTIVTAAYNWQDGGGRTLLRENRTVSFKTVGKAGWLLDWTCEMSASEGTVTFEDTKEGSMGIRVTDALTEKNGGKLVNSKGQTGEKLVWGREADWCAYTGKVGGKPVAIALLDHPQNPHRACWHARGYGLMAANPFGRKKSGFPDRVEARDLVRIPKGEKLTLRYGLVVLDGEWETASGQIAEKYAEWSKSR